MPVPLHQRIARWLVFAVAVGATAWVLSVAVPIIRSDWLSTQARQDVERWASGKRPWTMAQWEQARSDLETASAISPDDAVLHELIATLYMVRGNAEWGDGSETSPGVAHYRTAMQHQLKAIELRPRFPSTWANMALMHYAVASSTEETFKAWNTALQYGPNETEVKLVLLTVAKLAWPAAPDEVRTWVETVEPGATATLDKEFGIEKEPATAGGAAAVPASSPASTPAQ